MPKTKTLKPENAFETEKNLQNIRRSTRKRVDYTESDDESKREDIGEESHVESIKKPVTKVKKPSVKSHVNNRTDSKKIGKRPADDDFVDEFGEEDVSDESEDDHVETIKKHLSKIKLPATRKTNSIKSKSKSMKVPESRNLKLLLRPAENVIVKSELDLSDTDSDSCSSSEPPKTSKVPLPSNRENSAIPNNKTGSEAEAWTQNLKALDVKLDADSSPPPPATHQEKTEEPATSCNINLWTENLAALDVKPKRSSDDSQSPVTSKKGKILKKINSKKGVARLLKLGGEKEEDSSSEDDDWEKINEQANDEQVETTASKNVQVTIEVKKGDQRNKKERDFHEMLRLKVNRYRKQVQIQLHKASLVGTLAHGYLFNRMLNDETLMATALSLIPSAHCYPPKRTNLNYVEKLVKWFKQRFVLAVDEDIDCTYPDKGSLARCISSGRAESVEALVSACVVLCRSLGLSCRLVLSLQPLTSKVDSRELQQPKKEGEKTGASDRCHARSSDEDVECKVKASRSRSDTKRRRKDAEEEEQSPQSKKEVKGSRAKDRDRDVVQSKSNTKVSSCASRQSKRKKKEEFNKDELIDCSDSESVDFEKEKKKTKKKGKRGRPSTQSVQQQKQSKGKSRASEEESDGESVEKKRRKTNWSPVLESEKERREKKVKRAVNCWMEIYLEDEEQWVSMDCVSAQLHCDSHLERKAAEPMLYVMAFNGDSTWKDVTQRYASSFLSSTRKQRIECDSWARLLAGNTEAASLRSKAEDETLHKSLVDQPLPTAISDYKDHPLYALQRHLLKFEAVYPASCIPLGFIRGEAVYDRKCVKNLHSRETWLKEAKVVRIGETPYKIVKARPKWDRSSKKMMTDIPLELFGDWQIEDYIPPPAVNGQVPRNAYGNVELFLPRMLPRGTKHLQIAGLNKIARKLGIDCAPAMTGWDFHGGWSHPLYDGFVVCDEHVETLMDAWQVVSQEQEHRDREKREKRVYRNWRKLIRGLLIKQRIQAKYFSKLTDMDDFPDELEAHDQPSSSKEYKKEDQS